MCFRATESVVEDVAAVGHLFRVTVRDVAGDCRPPILIIITASIEENSNTNEGVPAGSDDLQYNSKAKERKRKQVTGEVRARGMVVDRGQRSDSAEALITVLRGR